MHDYPGTVLETALWRGTTGLPKSAIDVLVPIEESGERHLFLATSGRFPPAKDITAAVPIRDGIQVAAGTSGKAGSGVYSVGWDCESASSAEILAAMREKGLVEEVWNHTEEEYRRISKL